MTALPLPVPYHGTPYLAGQTIQAEDYDLGGEGVAYHDTTPTNDGKSTYRKTEGVDIGVLGSNGLDVGNAYPGEWIDYTISVAQAGTFTLSASVANRAAGGTFHVEIGGVPATGTMVIPNTGAWATFTTITSNQFTLQPGTQVMRVVLDKAGTAGGVGNFDFFQLNAVTLPPPPALPQLKWKAASPDLIGRMEGAGLAVNGKLYVFGGYGQSQPHWIATNEADVFDPATGKWARLADQPSPVTQQGFATDGRYVYLAGGYVSNPARGSQTFASSNTWRYDTLANAWAPFVPLPAARGAGAMVLLGGTLHYFGGNDVNLVGRADHWTLNLDDPAARWVASTPLPVPRNKGAAVVLNGVIYLIGGQAQGDNKSPEADVFKWNPAQPGVWTAAASLPLKFSHEAAVVANGMILTIAGYLTGGKPMSQVLAYNPLTDQWSNLASLPIAVASPSAVVIGNELIVSGGGNYYDLRKDTWISQILP